MRYTVVWTPLADDQLMDLWTKASDQQAVADAADRIEKDLRNDPDQKVRNVKGTAFYEVSPLVVALQIAPDDRLVRIVNVRVS